VYSLKSENLGTSDHRLKREIITSAKEVKFLPEFVCLSVCVLAR